jgi:hypothetical protein
MDVLKETLRITGISMATIFATIGVIYVVIKALMALDSK